MFATTLATIMVTVFIIANVIRQRKNGKLFTPATDKVLVCCIFVFIAGAAAANGLFHFVHGIGRYSDFPAPFAVLMSSAVITNVANVIWGVINFAISVFVILSYRKSMPKWLVIISFLVGFIFIAFMLRFVLLISYHESHMF